MAAGHRPSCGADFKWESMDDAAMKVCAVCVVEVCAVCVVEVCAVCAVCAVCVVEVCAVCGEGVCGEGVCILLLLPP
jgi:hypothetical protein